jgi:hypothetical protein
MKDILSSILFIVIGSIFLYTSNTYTIGRAANMGPGYFPSLISIGLIIIGIIIIIKKLYGNSK